LPSPLVLSPGLDRSLPPLVLIGADSSGAPMLDENVSCPVPGLLSARVREMGAILTRHALWPNGRGAVAGATARPEEATRLDTPCSCDHPRGTLAGDARASMVPWGCERGRPGTRIQLTQSDKRREIWLKIFSSPASAPRHTSEAPWGVVEDGDSIVLAPSRGLRFTPSPQRHAPGRIPAHALGTSSDLAQQEENGFDEALGSLEAWPRLRPKRLIIRPRAGASSSARVRTT
jgi:hypothetical protein